MYSQIIEEVHQGNYKKALNLSRKIENRAWVLIYYSRINELTGYFELSLQNARNALERSSNPRTKIGALAANAYALWRLFQFKTGFDSLKNLDSTSESQTDMETKVWIATSYNIRGLLHWKTGQFEEALIDFKQALDLRQKIGIESDVAYTLNNLGNTYLKLKDLNKTKKYFQQSQDLRNKIGYLPGIAASENSFGRLFEVRNQHITAQRHFHKSLKFWKKIGNVQFIGKAYRFLAINALLLEDMRLSRQYWEESDFCFTLIGNEVDLSTNTKIKSR